MNDITLSKLCVKKDYRGIYRYLQRMPEDIYEEEAERLAEECSLKYLIPLFKQKLPPSFLEPLFQALVVYGRYVQLPELLEYWSKARHTKWSWFPPYLDKDLEVELNYGYRKWCPGFGKSKSKHRLNTSTSKNFQAIDQPVQKELMSTVLAGLTNGSASVYVGLFVITNNITLDKLLMNPRELLWLPAAPLSGIHPDLSRSSVKPLSSRDTLLITDSLTFTRPIMGDGWVHTPLQSRLAIWETLKGLTGCTYGHFDMVKESILQTKWFRICADSTWFNGSDDIALCAVRSNGEIALIAMTDYY